MNKNVKHALIGLAAASTLMFSGCKMQQDSWFIVDYNNYNILIETCEHHIIEDSGVLYVRPAVNKDIEFRFAHDWYYFESKPAEELYDYEFGKEMLPEGLYIPVYDGPAEYLEDIMSPAM